MGLAALFLSGAVSIGNALSAFEDEIRASCPADLASRISPARLDKGKPPRSALLSRKNRSFRNHCTRVAEPSPAIRFG